MFGARSVSATAQLASSAFSNPVDCVTRLGFDVILGLVKSRGSDESPFIVEAASKLELMEVGS